LAKKSYTTTIAEQIVNSMEHQKKALMELMPVPPGMEEMPDRKASTQRIRDLIINSQNPEMLRMVSDMVGGPGEIMKMLSEEE
jgi:hypothetical protein